MNQEEPCFFSFWSRFEKTHVRAHFALTSLPGLSDVSAAASWQIIRAPSVTAHLRPTFIRAERPTQWVAPCSQLCLFVLFVCLLVFFPFFEGSQGPLKFDMIRLQSKRWHFSLWPLGGKALPSSKSACEPGIFRLEEDRLAGPALGGGARELSEDSCEPRAQHPGK